MIASKLVELARKEIGVEEVGKTNRGPRVDDYQRATWLKVRDWGAWCAAFICFLVREAMKTGGPYTFKRPQTAGAWDFERWSKEQDNSTQTKRNPGMDIKAGDIVIFKISHIGLATSAPDKDGYFKTIEGNSNEKGSRTGGKVVEQKRHFSKIKTRIRFTV